MNIYRVLPFFFNFNSSRLAFCVLFWYPICVIYEDGNVIFCSFSLFRFSGERDYVLFIVEEFRCS